MEWMKYFQAWIGCHGFTTHRNVVINLDSTLYLVDDFRQMKGKSETPG